MNQTLGKTATETVAELQATIALLQMKIESGDNQSARKRKQLEAEIEKNKAEIAALADAVLQEARHNAIGILKDANSTLVVTSNAADQAFDAHLVAVADQHTAVDTLIGLLGGAQGGDLVHAKATGKVADLLAALATIEALKREITSLVGQNAELQGKLDEQPAIDPGVEKALHEQITALETEKAAAAKVLEEARGTAIRLKNDLEAKGEEIARLHSKINENEETLRAYRGERNDLRENYNTAVAQREISDKALRDLQAAIKNAFSLHLGPATNDPDWLRKVPQQIRNQIADYISDLQTAVPA